MKSLLQRAGRIALATVMAVSMSIGAADARPSGGGSRGSKSFSAPPRTDTAPSQAQPLQRTQAQPGPQMGNQQMGGAAQTARPRSGLGFGGGLMAGLLGAGLLGMLMGNGFMGGLGGLASILGILLQVALIAGVVMLAIRFFRRRSETNLAGASASAYSAPGNTGPAQGPAGGMPGAARSGLGGGLGGGLGSALGGLGARGPAAAAKPAVAGTDTVGLVPDDYSAFERLLNDVQLAYGRQDVDTLRKLTTGEVASYMADDLAENERQGVINSVTDPKFLQGDLAEAWREGSTDYATVAMRFSIRDVVTERASGRVVSGDANVPTQATEVWTFRRDNRGPWLLSAIQQA